MLAKKDVHLFLSLSIYVFVTIFLLVNFYYDLISPVMQRANALFQGLVSGVPQQVVPLFTQFIPIIIMFSIVYILFFSVFWFVLSQKKLMPLLDRRLFILGVLIVSAVTLLIFQRFSAFVAPFILYTLAGILIGSICLYMYSGIARKFVPFLKTFSVHAVQWVALYFVLLTVHFLFSGLVYFFLRVDPYLTNWGYVLIILLWVLNVFVLQGIVYTHVLRSVQFWKNARSSYKIALPRLRHVLYVLMFFVILHGVDYMLSFVPGGGVISLALYGLVISVGAVWYASYFLEYTTHEIKS